MGDDGKRPQEHSASDDLKQEEKLGLLYIYRQGDENRFEMTIPVDEPMGKLYAIELLVNVAKAILTTPNKAFKPKIIQPSGQLLNRLRRYLPKKRR